MNSEVSKPWGMCGVVPGVFSFGNGGYPELNLSPSLQEFGAQGCLICCINSGQFFLLSLTSNFSSWDVKPGEPQLSSPGGR